MKKIYNEISNNFLYLIKPFFKYGKPYVFLILIPAIVLNPIISIVDVLFTEKFIDSILQNTWINTVLCVVIFQLIYHFCFIFSDIINTLWVPEQFQKASKKINVSIFKKSINTDFCYFDDPKFFDEYTWTLTQYVSKGDSCVLLLRNFLSNVFTIGALVILLSQNGFFITLITIVYVISTTILNAKIAQIAYEKNDDATPIERRKKYIHKLFYERQWAIDIKITSLSKILFKNYDNVYNEKLNIVKKYNKKMLFYLVIIKVLLMIETCVVLIYLSWMVYNGSINIAKVMSLFTAAISLRKSSSTFVDVFKKIKENGLYAKKIRAFFESVSTIENQKEVCNSNYLTVLQEKNFKIKIDNVTFGYCPDKNILNDINITIEPGEKVAIVGENGVGKTTLVKLLLRLYDPQHGSIYINDIPIQKYPVSDLRNKIGLVTQDCNLYAFTLRENMSVYGDTDDTNLIDLLSFFDIGIAENNKMTLDKYITKEFDKSGLVLSGGQKQKLCISRVFTKDFGLLILDEPSSALDPNSEYELTQLIYNRANTTTTILISHRLSTVKAADKIIVIGKNGSVIENGSHNSLISQKGVYYDMFLKQSKSYTMGNN